MLVRVSWHFPFWSLRMMNGFFCCFWTWLWGNKVDLKSAWLFSISNLSLIFLVSSRRCTNWARSGNRESVLILTAHNPTISFQNWKKTLGIIERIWKKMCCCVLFFASVYTEGGPPRDTSKNMQRPKNNEAHRIKHFRQTTFTHFSAWISPFI